MGARGVFKAAYRLGYSILPTRVAGYIDYRLARRPAVYHDGSVHPAGRLPRGVVTFSLDFELAWAWQYSIRHASDMVARGLHERAQVPRLLALFEAHGIPATWATVGHLFLEHCTRGAGGRAHESMARLSPFRSEHWRFDGGDWFQFDPCTDVRRDPAWYAPDLIEKILASPVGHEIGCHAFSHAGFGPYCPAEVAAAEIDACAEAMAPYGLSPRTFVFPRHDEGNFATLAAKGVRIVRAFPRPMVNISLPIQRPDGMWGVHVTSAIDRGRHWPLGWRLERLRNFVDTAAETRLAAHFWLHPSLATEELEQVLQPLVRYCTMRRDEGRIDVYTMSGLVDATCRGASHKHLQQTA